MCKCFNDDTIFRYFEITYKKETVPSSELIDYLSRSIVFVCSSFVFIDIYPWVLALKEYRTQKRIFRSVLSIARWSSQRVKL